MNRHAGRPRPGGMDRTEQSSLFGRHVSAARLTTARTYLADLGRIQDADLAKDNRRRRREGLPPLKPPFSASDVQRVKDLGLPLPYERRETIAPLSAWLGSR